MTNDDRVEPTTPDAARSVDLLQRVLGGFTVILIGLSWPLWLNPAGFPQVPVFSFLVDVPVGADRLISGGAFLAWGVAMLGGYRRRFGRVALAIAILSQVILMMLNQHRLQPWAYLAVLSGGLIVACPPRQTLSWMRALLVSVYIYSALGKFDYLFATSIGNQLLQTTLGFVGISTDAWNANLQIGLTLMLPLIELIAGLLLIFQRTRRFGVVLAVGLHLVLILVLGPFGMSQKPGVLVWNLQFCMMIPLLFWPLRESVAADSMEMPTIDRSIAWGAKGLVAMAIALPLLEPWGLWDPWLSWGLYSTRAPRAELYFAENYANRLPASLQPYVSEDLYNGYLKKLHLDRWSLETLNVPLYPSDRFAMGVTTAVLDKLRLDRGFVVVHSSAPDRWSGEREQKKLVKPDEISKRLQSYRVNPEPRQGFWLDPSH